MSDGQVRELAQQPETKGKQTAFRQILEGIAEKQSALPERIAFFNGQRAACAALEDRIQGLITQRIGKLAEQGMPREQIKDEQAFAHSLRNLAHNIGQDAMQEQLMLKGEARALLGQVESIGNLSKKAIADERTIDALEAGQEAFRQQVEDTMPSPPDVVPAPASAVESTTQAELSEPVPATEPEPVPVPKKEAAVEPKKTPARKPIAKSASQRKRMRRAKDKFDGPKG